MIERLRRSFRYEFWADRTILVAIAEAGVEVKNAERCMAHILSAMTLWLNRLEGSAQEMPVWPDIPLAKTERLIRVLEPRWFEFLYTVSDSDLGAVYTYLNSKGERWSSTIEDTLMHVLLHSSYHRGQIASALRRAGVDPPLTDFIHASRNELL